MNKNIFLISMLLIGCSNTIKRQLVVGECFQIEGYRDAYKVLEKGKYSYYIFDMTEKRHAILPIKTELGFILEDCDLVEKLYNIKEKNK